MLHSARCEICGFTCRQKASLNWHMKKHDADATYQFSCSICGKKFEKKDCVVAHKAKSHPEVLIAEALAANAGTLITTPASLLELQGAAPRPAPPDATGGVDTAAAGAAPGQQHHHVGHQVVLLGQDHQSLHTMQVPVTIALSPADPPSPDGRQQQQHLQLQMPLHFVQTSGAHGQQQQHPQQHPQIQQLTLTHSGSVVSQPQIQQLTLHSGALQLQPQQQQQQQQQQLGQTEVLHMTFQPVGPTQGHLQQIPLQLQALQTAPGAQGDAQHQGGIVANGDSYVLDTSVLAPPGPPALQQQGQAVVWEQAASEGGLADGGVQTLL